MLTLQHLLGAEHIFYISETRLLSGLQSVSLEERDGRLFSSQGSVVSGRCCRFIFAFRAPLKLVDDALYLDKYILGRVTGKSIPLCENLTDSQDAIKLKKVVLHIDSDLLIKFIV